MPEHEITLKIRVPLDRHEAEVYAFTTGESLIHHLGEINRAVHPNKFRVPYVRIDNVSIVSNT